MTDWLTATEVMDRLGLKPQTLYAYVSRGLIEAQSHGDDARKSLYRASDIGRLEFRKRRGRRRADVAEDAIAWGEPVMTSAITCVARGRLWYRGEDADVLAQTAKLEDVARLLWACGDARFPPQRWVIPEGQPLDLMFAALAHRVSRDAAMRGRAAVDLYIEAASILDLMVDVVAGGPGYGAIHQRLARAWNCRRKGADLIRKALVVLADHELNASTFAARVTASTGASLAAAVLAGLAALSGPLHGGMTARVGALIDRLGEKGAAAAIEDMLAKGMAIPGFGHPLYPDGDPRARTLLADLDLPKPFADAAAAMEAATGAKPTIDFALAALAVGLQLPPNAPFLIFAIARTTGWIAHAIEQHQTGRLIRPRARYIGPSPGRREPE
jgi:citrate synthase